MKKGPTYMESEFWICTSNLVDSKVKLQRGDKFYKGIVKKEGRIFYLLGEKKIRIRPSDKISSLETKLK